MVDKKPRVPFIAEKILRALAKSEDEISLIGDFEEEYCSYIRKHSRLKAWFWYWINTLNSAPRFLSNSIFRFQSFLKIYFKISYRNIIRQKSISAVNISGLSIGMTCCFLISLWIADELSFDGFHENSDNIYRIESDENHNGRIFHSYSSPHQFVPIARQTIPEIIAATRCSRFGGIQIKRDNSSYYEPDVIAADTDIFKMFSFPFIEGDSASALIEPNSIVISERTAERYFGKSTGLLGEIITVENEYDFKITGVLKNGPDNSSIRLDIVIPFDFVINNLGRMPNKWLNAITNYVMTRDDAARDVVESKITETIRQNSDIETGSTYLLNPITRIHLHTYTGYEKSLGYIQFVYIFSIIAIFVLLIACINYMSLSTASSAKRAKEIGVRKVAGALRRNILGQFLYESAFVTILSILISFFLVILILPSFNSFTGKNISLLAWKTPYFYAVITGIVVLTGILSGGYPALYLSSFSPVTVLKDIRSVLSGKNPLIRKFLVAFQFILALTLIISSLVVYRQVDFMQSSSTGFNRENLICIPLRGEMKQNYDAIRNELLKSPLILNVSASNRRPSYIGDFSRDVTWNGKAPDQDITFVFGVVEHDFIATMDLQIIRGRGFSEDYTNDRTGAFIINEKALEQMGIESPVGHDFSIMGIEGRIIGVMKDFHFQPFYEEIKPLVIFLSPNPYWMGNIIVRISNDSESSMEFINNLWKRMFPDYSFSYTFLTEDYEMIYRNEARLSTLLKYFTFLSVFLALLGLLGLVSYTVEQRIKEIGIRRVLGSSINGIVMLLYKDYLKLIVISFIITCPLAYKIADSWLQKFAYRIEPEIYLFIITGILSLSATLAVVGFQSMKAAVSDPVKTLKYE
jgi:ABC-type antimicrobial peptide transport system permease subunit